VPFSLTNAASARARGAELTADWIVNRRLRLQGTAAVFRLREQVAPDSLISFNDIDAEFTASGSARLDLPANTGVDLTWRHVGSRPHHDIQSYDSVNLRLGWRPVPTLELSLAVDNLLDDEHVEFFDEDNQQLGDVMSRSFFATVRWSPRW
jgi:iron complex outermembrane receptor protein